MDKASGAMVYGGGGTVIAANSDKVHEAVNSEIIRETVNFLHYPLFEIGDTHIAPNTICTILGIAIGLYGVYRNHISKKSEDK